MRTERVCDQRNCQSPVAEYCLEIKAVEDPDAQPANRGRQVLALVLSCTRTPARVKLPDGKETLNPDWNPADLVPVARWTRGFDVCGLDCFLGQMEDLWKLGQRRAKRLWETGERDWR